jgi:hemerythrin-like domain-containing protein
MLACNGLLILEFSYVSIAAAITAAGGDSNRRYKNITAKVKETMLARLLVEHDHILKTLNFLEMQFLDLCRGGTPDYALMRSILEYIQEYPEQVHHPLEDKVFSILLDRVDETGLVRELIAEHAELEIETRKLRESLKLLENGSVTSGQLMKQLSTFLIRQRQHMYIEEEKVHPLIERTLTRDDWDHLQSSVSLYKP